MVLLLSSTLYAQSPQIKENADDLLTMAFFAFENLDFQGAHKYANEALLKFKDNISTSKDGYVQTLHLIAAIYLLEGNKERAKTTMNDAILFSKEPPSEKKFNPSFQTFYKSVLDGTHNIGQGSVKLTCSPKAMVAFNGILHGPAQGLITLRAGSYFVKIYQPGDSPWHKWIQIKPDKITNITVFLSPNQSQVDLSQNSFTAKCIVDQNCPTNTRCINNSCTTPTPLTHRWWFWTAIGATVAGAAAGIAIAFTRPEQPIIEVK